MAMRKEISHKPHLFIKHGRWRCVTHNAAGEGDSWFAAYVNWKNRQTWFKHQQGHRSYRPPGYVVRKPY